MNGRARGALVIALAGLAATSRLPTAFQPPRVRAANVALQASARAAPRNGDRVRDLIAAVIDGRDTALGALSGSERAQLSELYYPSPAPLWFDAARRPTANMREALDTLTRAADDGLDPRDYFRDPLIGLTSRTDDVAVLPDLVRLDLALSAGMLRFLQHVHIGRIDPRTVGVRLEAAPDRHDVVAELRAAIAGRRVAALVADRRPPLAQYRLLRSLLPRYRSLAADPTVAAPRRTERAIHPGEPFADTGALERLLIALGDMAATAPSWAPQRYDGAIVDGIKRFQRRHGLDADGVLGKSTAAALRVPFSWRVRQIELALERLRWLPHLGDERLIALNIPMFRLWAWDAIPPGGAPLFGMDAIVGRALSTQTPVFVDEMREVIFRPYWNVPQSILRHEVLPRLERDPGYLRREDMEIVRGAGDDALPVALTADALEGLRRGALRVRQRPGPRNALGAIKFVFPNRENVYLHGTPERALFARMRRDFSHGCVRVADPIALAVWVLQDRPEWTRDRIITAANGAETLRVPLRRPIQVVLFYTTAAVMPEDGTIHFADDIYQNDAKLDGALAMHRFVR